MPSAHGSNDSSPKDYGFVVDSEFILGQAEHMPIFSD